VTAAPLAGIRVLDLTTFLSGPYAAMVLGQLGADVVKIEPAAGDPTRAGQPIPDSDFWFALHRGKRSVVLDLKLDTDRADFLGLVAGADVVLDNFRPGVVERLGITPSELRTVNPRIVSCSITGYGREGTRRDAPAIDGVVQASAGAYELTGGFDPVPLQIADLAGGNAAAQAVLAALLARAGDGVGRHIELSLVECVVNWLAVADRSGTLRWPNTIVGLTRDARRLVVQTPLHFRTRLAELLGLTYEPTDAYGDSVALRFAERSAAEWIARFAAEGIPAAIIESYAGALAGDEVTTEVVLGRRVVASPFVFDGERADTARRAVRSTSLSPACTATTGHPPVRCCSGRTVPPTPSVVRARSEGDHQKRPEAIRLIAPCDESTTECR